MRDPKIATLLEGVGTNLATQLPEGVSFILILTDMRDVAIGHNEVGHYITGDTPPKLAIQAFTEGTKYLGSLADIITEAMETKHDQAKC